MELARIFLLSVCTLSIAFALELPEDWAHDIKIGSMLFSATVPQQGDPEGNLLPNVGNGHVAHVVRSADAYVSGVYKFIRTGFLMQSSERARIPAPPIITPREGQYAGMALSMSSGTVYERYTIDEKSSLELRHYAHRIRPNILVTELVLNGSAHVDLEVSHAAPSQDIDFQGNVTFAVGSVKNVETGGDPIWVAVQRSSPPDSVSGPTHLFLITSIAAASTRDAAVKSAAQAFNMAQEGTATLSSEHMSAWAELWSSGIFVEGNSSLQALAQSTMYYILSSASADSYWPMSPGGLPTNGYWGIAFWDQELWILPAMLPFHPDFALAGAEYRLKRFPQALAYAKETGFKGARFPWQTAVTGYKTDLAPTNALEIHVSADIAVYFESVFDITKDMAWLSRAYPLIAEVANFYVSRSTKTEANYTFKGVVPPDEFALGRLSITHLYTGVDDSAYTNYVAQRTLRFAARAASLLDQAPSSDWAVVANGIILPTAACGNACQDTGQLIHPEYSGFPNGNWHLYGGGTVKQADVALMYYPLMMDSASLSADLAYYASRYFAEGPAMTDAVSSILYLDANDRSSSIQSFYTVEKHAHAPFYVWTEDKHRVQKSSFYDMGCYNFLTGAGGYVQALSNGFGGLGITRDGLRVKGTLPPGATAFTLRGLKHANSSFDVRWHMTSDDKDVQGTACVNKGSLQTSTNEYIAAGSCFVFTGEVVFRAARSHVILEL